MCGLCAGFEQIGVRENVRVFGKSAKIVRFLRKKLWQHCPGCPGRCRSINTLLNGEKFRLKSIKIFISGDSAIEIC